MAELEQNQSLSLTPLLHSGTKVTEGKKKFDLFIL